MKCADTRAAGSAALYTATSSTVPPNAYLASVAQPLIAPGPALLATGVPWSWLSVCCTPLMYSLLPLRLPLVNTATTCSAVFTGTPDRLTPSRSPLPVLKPKPTPGSSQRS